MNETKTKKVDPDKGKKIANIVVIAVAALAVLVLVAIIVLSTVKVNPNDKLEKPNYYNLYNVGEKEAVGSNTAVQSEISAAVNGMDFTVMSAILEGHWDYSLGFKRNASDEKIELTAADVKAISSSDDEYMIELVYSPASVNENGVDYSTAHALTVDGETVYYDTIKMLIGDTNGTVGTISLYPYLQCRLDNKSDIESIDPATYRVTGINVRANTSNSYAALKELVSKIKAGVEI